MKKKEEFFRTSIKLPHTLEKEMLTKIVSDGYGMRGKSKWVAEAITAFLELPDYGELTNYATEITMLDKSISVKLPEEITAKLDKALIEVRKFYPEMEGVRSNLIRASILQRLIGRTFPVTGS